MDRTTRLGLSHVVGSGCRGLLFLYKDEAELGRNYRQPASNRGKTACERTPAKLRFLYDVCRWSRPNPLFQFDLKSPGRKAVQVRALPPAPFVYSELQQPARKSQPGGTTGLWLKCGCS